MSEHAYSKLNVLEKVVVDEFVGGEDVDEDGRGFRKWIRKVWWGTSRIGDRVEVKRLCCGEEETRKATAWDNDGKRWGTHSLENVPKLIASGLWKPDGIDERLADIIAGRAMSILDAEERERREKEEKKLEKERQKERQKAEKAAKGKAKAKAIFGGGGSKRKIESAADAAAPESKMAKAQDEEEEADEEAEQEPKLPESFHATEADFVEALEVYKLPRHVFIEATTWGWLGPTCSSSIIRIRRWFDFKHNHDRGVDAVSKEDFLSFSEKRAIEQQKAKDEADLQARMDVAAISGTTAAVKVTDVDKLAKMKEREQTRVKRNQEAAAQRKHEEEHGGHATALKAILAMKAGPIKLTTVLRCPECKVKPLKQFMECACTDANARDWRVCQTCDTVYHPAKVSCSC